jgi:Rrf2 family protein
MVTTASVKYGLLAVAYLARNQDKGIVRSQMIVKEYNIPLEYLFKIMQQLVRAHILRSKRGPRGGFSLARPAAKITMLDIIEAVEGPMARPLNIKENAPRDKFGTKVEQAYAKVIAHTRAELKKVKVSDLI